MSNEELAALIQNGDREQLAQLWAQVRGIALREARRWVAYHSGGVELDDLEQAGFIALMLAVDSFDPAVGTQFSTWYYPIMRGEFQRAAGRSTTKQAKDPLHQAGSLDAPVGADEDGATLGELQPDPAAEAAILAVEDREQQNQLHTALERAMAVLPEQQRSALKERYYQGRTFEAIAAANGVCKDTAKRWHDKGLRVLRHPAVRHDLDQFRIL